MSDISVGNNIISTPKHTFFDEVVLAKGSIFELTTQRYTTSGMDNDMFGKAIIEEIIELRKQIAILNEKLNKADK